MILDLTDKPVVKGVSQEKNYLKVIDKMIEFQRTNEIKWLPFNTKITPSNYKTD